MPEDLSLDAIRDIPDPAAGIAAARVPEAAPPTERSLTRDERRTRARAAAVAAAVWVAAALALFGVRADIASPRALAPIVAWLAAGALAFALVLRPRARGLPAGVRVVQHAVWLIPAAYALTAVVVSQPAEVPLAWATVRGCLCLSTLMALGPLLAGAILLRGAFPSAPGWRGAAVGAVLGLAGSIGAHAHCPVGNLGHLLAAHGAAIAIAAAAGGALGRLGGRP